MLRKQRILAGTLIGGNNGSWYGFKEGGIVSFQDGNPSNMQPLGHGPGGHVAHLYPVSFLAAPNDTLGIATRQGKIVDFHTLTKKPLGSIVIDPRYYIGHVVQTEDGKICATAVLKPNRITVYHGNKRTEIEVESMSNHEICRTGALAVLSSDKSEHTVRVYRPGESTPYVTYIHRSNIGKPHWMRFLNASQILIISHAEFGSLSLETGEFTPTKVRNFFSPNSSAAICQDGRHAFLCSNRTGLLYDSEAGIIVQRYPVPIECVIDSAFSLDGSRCCVIGANGEISVVTL